MSPATRVVVRLMLLLAVSVGAAPGGWATLPPVDGLLAPDPPTVTARSWILYDDTFGKVLAEQAAGSRSAIASTTKIMTALVVIEQTEPDDSVSVSARAAAVGESEIGLVAGEAPWPVEEMLAALLLRSANDAAVALAEHVGGSVAGFADLMNEKALRLGLTNSRFVNPHGLDHSDHYSSARDLLVLSIAAMEQPRFSDLVQARSVNLPTGPDGTPRVAVNRNRLMGSYPGALGIKTGYTGRALQTFAAAAERAGRRLYAVVLGSTQHFDDAAALLDYGFAGFGPTTLVPATSDDRRPLAGDLGVIREEGFELFLVPDPDQPLPDEPGTDGGSTSTDALTELDTEDPEEDPIEREGSAEPVGDRVERSAQLPDLGDALGWFRHYWSWIRGAA